MADQAFRIDGPLLTGIDQAGDPLAGGKLYLYEKRTTTPKASWQDEAKTVPNTHPIILDSAGRGRASMASAAHGSNSVRKHVAYNLLWRFPTVLADPKASGQDHLGKVIRACSARRTARCPRSVLLNDRATEPGTGEAPLGVVTRIT